MNSKPKSKNKLDSLLREAKPKNRLGLKVPTLRMPHDDLISLASPTSQTSQTNQEKDNNSVLYDKTTKVDDINSSITKGPVSPTSDFQKVPNSLTKKAIPEGFFKGKSKQLYDTLYSLTRGAIKPRRSIRISKSKLMKLANIGSRITFDSNIKHLQSVGLVIETVYIGEHEGNLFEILLPEESASETSLTSVTSSTQKQDRLVSLETGQTSHTTNVEPINTYKDTKTSLKTLNTNDDEKSEILTEFIERFDEASKNLTGKGLKASEKQRWSEIADLLIMELELAAARTESISSVPAFLKEVLRRKLETKNTRPKRAAAKGVSKSLQVGKPTTEKPEDSEEWETEFLTDEEKQKTLQIMRERIKEGHQELVMSMEPTYTPEDWEWLMKNLEQGS